MHECQMLHETVVRDIIDVINDVKNFDRIDWLRNRNNTGSIAKRASNLVLVFPVIVSNSINIQTATIISKAIERKCVSLLQILFSSVNYTQADNVYDYIKQFHTNLDPRMMNLDDFITIMDGMVDEGAIEITDYDAYNAAMDDMKNIGYYLKETFNPTSINDFHTANNMYGESYIVKEAKGDAVIIDRDKFGRAARGLIANDVKAAANRAVRDRSDELYNMSRDRKTETDFFRYQLLPQDVQKANELVPTTMMVNFTSVKDGVKINTTGVIGVKAKLYPVDAMEIINRITSKVKESNGLFNLIRATTREISFFKDLAFAIDKAKIDAVNMAKDSGNAKMFKVLERRAAKNRFSTLLKKNDASPITSLVISQDEVEYLKKYNDLDMEKSYVTRSILEAYNLMDIVIADESLELAKFLYDDGEGTFETLPFDALEKEAKDSSYKKVLNLMSKINR